MRRPSEPALVLLPGMDGTGALLAGFRRALDPAIRTVVVSYPPDQEIGYAGLEGSPRAQLPQDEPFVLLAESFSGPIAISIAASRPAGLRGLILVCSFARNPRPLLAAAASSGLAPADPLGASRACLPGRRSAALRRLTCGPSCGRPARVSPSVVRRRLRAVLEIDVAATVAQSRRADALSSGIRGQAGAAGRRRARSRPSRKSGSPRSRGRISCFRPVRRLQPRMCRRSCARCPGRIA